MASRIRVFDETTKRRVDPDQAERWVQSGVYAWVDAGTIRKLTLAEMVQTRAELSAPDMPVAELRGVVTRGIEGVRRELNLAWQGTLFGSPRRVEALAAELAR